MKTTLLTFLLAALSLVAVACAPQPATSQATPEPAAPPTATVTTIEELVINLERTACFGFCPIYTVTIEGDGTVTYEGRDFVEVEGTQTAQISQEQVQELVDVIREIRYFGLKDSYTEECDADGNCSTVTDLPSANTTVNLNGQIKSITNYYGGPAELEAFEDKIDEIANTQQWIGDVSP